MTLTGPQKYPGASLSRWYQTNYPGNAMESNVGVIHTTEGTSLPSYSGGSSAPNFTAVPDIPNKKLKWYQHFDFDRSSRALVNKSGGVETNTLNVVQIELVGTCDPTHKSSWSGAKAGVNYLFWPDAPDWALKELAVFVKWAYDNHGVKLEQWPQGKWLAYPNSYGSSNGQRMTGSQWTNFYGWCGHQHVPENDHGDPGNLRMDKVLAYAKGTDVGTGEDMALTDEEIHKIWYADEIPAQPEPYNNSDWPDNQTWTVKYTLYTTVRAGRETLERVKNVESDIAAIKAKVESMASTGLTADQVQAIASAVADQLSSRLAD